MYLFLCLTFMMFCWHAVADYSLQSDFIANAKNPNTEVGKVFWTHVLTGHALVHAGGVFMITHSLTLGIAEFVLHWLTDLAKCNNRISLDTDQRIHYGSKILWAVIASIVVLP